MLKDLFRGALVVFTFLVLYVLLGVTLKPQDTIHLIAVSALAAMGNALLVALFFGYRALVERAERTELYHPDYRPPGYEPEEPRGCDPQGSCVTGWPWNSTFEAFGDVPVPLPRGVEPLPEIKPNK